MNAILPRRRLSLALAAALTLAAGCSTGPAPQPRRALPPVPPLAKAVVRTAKTYLPEEEKGRRTPKDCSDFVHKVFLENGLDLPRTSQEMSLVGDRVKSSKDLRMGDLVFFSGEKVTRIVGHVGIYVNNGIFIHLPSSGVVVMESLYSDYYRARYLAARRVIP
ncbi:MAG: C40 family peptidase [Elusimicrobia bacterium]|nr:C40 family peptidase [Elusimicrobiota bacterium]